MQSIGLHVAFTKSAADGSYVRGWASVIAVDGETVQDYQGDRISIEVPRDATHEFVLDQRVAKVMHSGVQIGDVVESVIVDDEFAESLGVTDSRRGWWIGMKIKDETAKAKVRSREPTEFSIGGTGVRVPIEGDDA